jgi:subtilisin family serine protease
MVMAEPGHVSGAALDKIKDAAGVRIRSTAREGGVAALQSGEGVVLEHLGIVLADTDPDQAKALAARASTLNGAVLAVEPEEIFYALPLDRQYVSGFRDAVSVLSAKILDDFEIDSIQNERPDRASDAQALVNWGLAAIGADRSRLTGDGTLVAVLDTGFAANHPDFGGRPIDVRSFIDGVGPSDLFGHGTHCIGTVGGPRGGGGGSYGVAPRASIFSGKVLGDDGKGSDFAILAGMEAAVAARATVISLSLGAPRRRGSTFETRYEMAGRRALDNGCVIVAAAGNEADQGADFVVGVPANSPSILAVAAVDERLAPASFSNPSSDAYGGMVDIAAPGVDILSSVPLPKRYDRFSGTSMATPHVAGVLALIAEAHPGLRGRGLVQKLFEYSQRLPAPSTRVGLGLVRAPSAP